MMGFGGMWLWLILLGIAVVLLWRWLDGRSEAPREREGSPLEILKRRYARGEIGREEFEERKRNLESPAGPSAGEGAS